MLMLFRNRTILVTALIASITTAIIFFQVHAESNDFVPADPWYGEDGTVCEFSQETDLFINCFEFVFYNVSGRSRSELVLSMHENGPSEGNGITLSRLEWGEDSNENCMLGVFSTITLPVHQDVSELSSSFQEYWNTTLSALTSHEKNHHNIAVREAWIEFQNGCQEVEDLANRIDILNEKYDHDTDHGAREGARF